MKDAHLTLRLPRELARVLARWARERGRPKSELVREAVAAYVAPTTGAAPRTLTAAELAARWRSLPRLTTGEAATLGADVESARRLLPPVRAAWK